MHNPLTGTGPSGTEPVPLAAAAAAAKPNPTTASLPLRPRRLLADSPSPPRIIIIGAGSRGHAYASAITTHTAAIIAAVAEPVAFKRDEFVATYIAPFQEQGRQQAHPHAFSDWREYVAWETERRRRGGEEGIDAAFVGNWRRESTTAPSLLTKSCHDVDFLLWMLSEPAREGERAHTPAFLSSTGKLNFYRKARKPAAAGTATNCLSCPIEEDCMFSAKKIYGERQLRKGNAKWPVKIVNPEIEDCLSTMGLDAAEKMLMKDLSEDWTSETPEEEVRKRPWFGRCVWEADNDVCDDQCVTITWEDDAASGSLAKTAQFHMVAFTEKQCERRGRIYGTKGEIEYDSVTIKVFDFATDRTETFYPEQRGGGHGGGDDGLATQFVQAVGAVKDGRMSVEEAQKKFIGCTLEEVIQSHAMVFAAEEARKQRAVVEWPAWWQRNVEERLQAK
ncbi:hypothetical protein MPH_02630 [Macrophomina phaseolina MS6]|uniref:Uncharacterized protein n=1 Tax=Macrophomina phaseolina (strain MS6) TaxID=1126212 RepID=K2RC46_MACPH|nr:hypothetical protein MPH_02630 [Macrophomina phaseolina MS6]